jgi:hypothetical protein
MGQTPRKDDEKRLFPGGPLARFASCLLPQEMLIANVPQNSLALIADQLHFLR